MTDAQIHQYIRQYKRTHKNPPTLQDIADGVGMSTGGIHPRLKKLGLLGQLDRPANR